MMMMMMTTGVENADPAAVVGKSPRLDILVVGVRESLPHDLLD
jgi:hypothetical protein